MVLQLVQLPDPAFVMASGAYSHGLDRFQIIQALNMLYSYLIEQVKRIREYSDRLGMWKEWMSTVWPELGL